MHAYICTYVHAFIHTLLCIALQYTTLNYIALHYITLPACTHELMELQEAITIQIDPVEGLGIAKIEKDRNANNGLELER